MKTYFYYLYYVVGYIFIIGVMILLAYLWNDAVNDVFYNGSRCFFLENRAEDIRRVALCVFKEELIWRFLPILVASAAVLFIKYKWLKIMLGILFGIAIIYIQGVFGAMHYNPDFDFPVYYNIFQQGGTGLILVLTNVLVMSYQLRPQWCSTTTIPSKLKSYSIALFFAYVAGCIVHAVSNVLIVYTQTF